jgi:hypothetical protein
LSPTAKEEDPEAGVPKSWLRRRITQTLSPDVLKAAQSQPRRQSGNPDIESGLGGEKNQSRNQTSEWEEIEAPWITSPGFDESEKQQQREGGGTWNTLQMFREKTKGLSAVRLSFALWNRCINLLMSNNRLFSEPERTLLIWLSWMN